MYGAMGTPPVAMGHLLWPQWGPVQPGGQRHCPVTWSQLAPFRHSQASRHSMP